MGKTLGVWASKRKRYYTMVHTYEMRRTELRKKYGIVNICNIHSKYPIGYITAAKKYNTKLTIWRKAIRRIDTLVNKIAYLERAIFDFTDIRIANFRGMKVDKDVWIAKALYYKFGLENGMRNVDLRDYIGLSANEQRDEPTRFRTKFTSSFKNTPENKEQWLRFKDFHNNELNRVNFAQKRSYGTMALKRG